VQGRRESVRRLRRYSGVCGLRDICCMYRIHRSRLGPLRIRRIRSCIRLQLLRLLRLRLHRLRLRSRSHLHLCSPRHYLRHLRRIRRILGV
jgi:hypothetical protein